MDFNWRALTWIACLFLAFLIGFLASEGINYLENLKAGISGYVVDAPSNFINNENILIYPDKVVIQIENASLSNYDSTGSMLPILKEGTSGITIKPKSVDELNVGDIVSFRKDGELVVHRIVEKGDDEQGVYFITKGDNSEVADWKIRFEDIEHVLIGLVY